MKRRGTVSKSFLKPVSNNLKLLFDPKMKASGRVSQFQPKKKESAFLDVINQDSGDVVLFSRRNAHSLTIWNPKNTIKLFKKNPIDLETSMDWAVNNSGKDELEQALGSYDGDILETIQQTDRV